MTSKDFKYRIENAVSDARTALEDCVKFPSMSESYFFQFKGIKNTIYLLTYDRVDEFGEIHKELETMFNSAIENKLYVSRNF